MDSDPQTTSGSQEQPDQERQNRRQFFNGLGKWSLAIIAAVTSLRDGLHDLESAIGSRFEIGSGGLDESRQRIAKKKRPPHSDEFQPHYDHGPHLDSWQNHYDHADAARQAPGGGTIRVPGGSKDKIE